MRNILIFLMLLPFHSIGSDYVFESWETRGSTCVFKFAHSPSQNWDGKSEVPLSINQVNAAFQKWALSSLPKTQMAHVVSFNFSSVAPKNLDSNFWVYKIGYVVFENNIPASNFNRKLVIDLASVVIEPECG
ncbi:hypothetical protein [Pseudoalteromonas ruthenica]|uniref:hypothetical protein n=1 Tax=Pseudoalteromonas ruthenica TaxID=151081 RepID=UPI00110BB20F|nr:hypothetical protein [Pseudoalteromonas ruthenica]TMO42234.1 hypothetical protein CWC24_18045 [Pseudoalteromonas ruthenica]TMO50915.1 hypothetical protein CWC23_09805 [Pseudoalteromonas ruthenica]